MPGSVFMHAVSGETSTDLHLCIILESFGMITVDHLQGEKVLVAMIDSCVVVVIECLSAASLSQKSLLENGYSKCTFRLRVLC